MESAVNILKKAKEYRDETARILSEIVKIPSVSGDEKAVVEALESICRRFGMTDIRTDGLGNLLVRVGSGDKILAIDAHIDTVAVGDKSLWQEDPFSGRIHTEHVYGRGSADQKGGAAAMITAGRILTELGYSGPYTVLFTFTILEEDCDGMCWKYLIEEEGIKPDYFVSTEPSSLVLTRGHRGRMEMKAAFSGISCHGSAPERGVNAAYKASRAALEIEALNERLEPDEEHFLGKGTVTVTGISSSGPSQCAVPDQGELYLDRRLTWGETKESAVAEVLKAVNEETCTVEVPWYDKTTWKGTQYGQELYFPTWKIPEDHPLVLSGVAAHKALFGEAPKIDKWTFSTNAVSVCGRHGIPSIGFGPGDEKEAHAPNEKNRIADLERASAFYAMLPYMLDEA